MERAVEIEPGTVDALKKRRASQIEKRLAAGLGKLDGAVFATFDSRRWSPDWVTRQFTKKVNELGLKPIPLHGAPHTSITIGYSAGVNAAVLKEKAGHHSSSYTIDTYGSAGATLQQEAIDKIAAYKAALRGR